MQEIRRVAPIYRDVVPESTNGEAIWDRSLFPLTARPIAASPASAVPAPTLPLDHLEVRFQKWFEGLFEKR